VPRAVERHGADCIAICSLTKTAAAEIATRDLPIPLANVGTLHSLAYRALGGPGVLTIAESEIASWNAAQPLLRLSGGGGADDLGERRRATPADELMALANVYRNQRVERSRWREDVARFQARWEAWMNYNGLVDFTGLVEGALESSDAPGDPAVFVVDEAQDCSVLELDLIRTWAARADSLVLSGDGDQQLYGFRGSEAARAFTGPEIPASHNYTLTQSYRVPRAVHAVASRWIATASERFAVEYAPRDFEGEVSESLGHSQNPEPIVREALSDAEAGRSVMILATCGFFLRKTIALLRKEGVPFCNPYRPKQGEWNPLRGGATRLAAFLRPDPRTYDDVRMWTWDEAKRWTEPMRASAFATGGKSIIAHADEERQHDEITPEEGRACFGASWDELRSVFVSGDPLAWFEDNLRDAKRASMEYALAVARRNRKALWADPLICVGTVHSVKGGESACVYLLNELSGSSVREWLGRGRDSVIRVFYVGMTRAKEKLVMGARWTPASVDWRGA